ncbi:hypothetical protein WMY93_001389 [Mugilogobius chulae]|uniref:Zona pellucida sperm-binding protein 3 n=1 Tax=Mugilogobius chulae TaxID=88201 RepID=A0AAW0Q1M7_9GOBI
MSKTLALCVNILVLLTLTKSQVQTNGADLPQSVLIPNHQSGRPRASAQPVRAVVVRCHPDSWEVVVQADLFSTGLMVERSHLHLGVEGQKDPHACTAVPSGPSEFTIWAHLMDCGTVKHPPSEENIVYSNVLVYAPKPSSDGLLRLDGVKIPVECHYNKFYSVNSFSLIPTWAPFVLRTSTESQVDFSLKLMTGDWQFERNSHVYYVGDPIYFEASTILGNHKPLRVFVDHCVATVSRDTQTALRYDFIDHYGCLADAYLTNSSAHFLSRAEDRRIKFQLDAFRFYQENTNQIYITCQLTAIPTLAKPVKSKHRACSLIANKYVTLVLYKVCLIISGLLSLHNVFLYRWRSADGNDEDCRSCGIPYPVKETFTATSPTTTSPRGQGQSLPKHQPANYMHIRPRTHQNGHSKPSSPTGLMKEREKRKGVDRTFAEMTKELVDNTYYNIAMVTRKLSGVLIMLLLFAFGYFVQRMLCSRSRQLSAPYSGPPTAAASQEMLMESYTPDSLRSPALSAPLPSYDDLKRLPTYEETIRESCVQHETLNSNAVQ